LSSALRRCEAGRPLVVGEKVGVGDKKVLFLLGALLPSMFSSVSDSVSSAFASHAELTTSLGGVSEVALPGVNVPDELPEPALVVVDVGFDEQGGVLNGFVE